MKMDEKQFEKFLSDIKRLMSNGGIIEILKNTDLSLKQFNKIMSTIGCNLRINGS